MVRQRQNLRVPRRESCRGEEQSGRCDKDIVLTIL